VTERKELEEQLRQAQKMEAVGRLAGGVAHDFNNVLMVIGGSAEMAMDELPEGDAMRAELQVICDAAASGASLTRQLLLFSRRQAVEPRLIELNAVVRSVEKMLHRLVGEDIRVTVVLEPRATPVLADVGHIEQILMNLAVNARDAMPRGGTLSICTALVEPEDEARERGQGSAPPARVSLTVSDTGTGMDAEVKSHLFEPFFTTKSTGEGTGLGLATVYGIVQQSGGHIEVASEPNQGTTVKILLPLADRALAVASALSEEQLSQRGSETVLVVEDEAPVRDLVSKILRRHGYTVVSAGSLREALAGIWSRQAAIDLLLTDVVMPSDSGPQLAKTLCRQCPGMAVLFISGHGDAALRSYGVPESGITLLHKPFSSHALLVKVREALDSHRTTRPSASQV
jgi:nitrogen-specific signal transduction histidine kinase/ActR/RegA family two-component response regulator